MLRHGVPFCILTVQANINGAFGNYKDEGRNSDTAWNVGVSRAGRNLPVGDWLNNLIILRASEFGDRTVFARRAAFCLI